MYKTLSIVELHNFFSFISLTFFEKNMHALKCNIFGIWKSNYVGLQKKCIRFSILCPCDNFSTGYEQKVKRKDCPTMPLLFHNVEQINAIHLIRLICYRCEDNTFPFSNYVVLITAYEKAYERI
jgi:hypothetical protein